MENPKKSLKYLKELESLGEEILIDRREIIALDNRRNQTREGLRALKKCKDDKTWFVLGPLLMKVPTKLAEDLLTKGKYFIYQISLKNVEDTGIPNLFHLIFHFQTRYKLMRKSTK